MKNPAPHRDAPPEELLREALIQLALLNSYVDLTQSAVHLALPAGELVGSHARCVDGNWWWRGRCLAAPEAGDDPVEFALRLVRAGATPADSWSWPSGSPASWLRFTRSGTRIIAWGSRALFNGPRLTFSPRVSAEDRAQLVVQILDKEITSPAVTTGTNATLFISGGPGWIHVSSSHDPATSLSGDTDTQHDLTQTKVRAAELLREVSGSPLAEVVDGPDPARFEVRVRVEGHTLHLDVHFELNALQMGTPPVAPLTGAGTAPHGWDLIGTDEFGRTVACKQGVLVRVTGDEPRPADSTQGPTLGV